MDVTEQAEEQRTVETGVPEPAAEVPSDVPSVEIPPSTPEPEQPPFNISLLRLAYAFEFWIALIAIFTVWSQVGGQGHLDLIAWYLKLTVSVALAWAGVRMTGAIVEHGRAWNRSTVKWFMAVVALAALAGGITYWYHLHEVPDEPGTDENSATSVSNRAVEGSILRVLNGRSRENC